MINTSQVLMLSYFSMLFKHFLRYFAVNFYLFFQFAILSPRLTFSPENLETIFYHISCINSVTCFLLHIGNMFL